MRVGIQRIRSRQVLLQIRVAVAVGVGVGIAGRATAEVLDLPRVGEPVVVDIEIVVHGIEPDAIVVVDAVAGGVTDHQVHLGAGLVVAIDIPVGHGRIPRVHHELAEGKNVDVGEHDRLPCRDADVGPSLLEIAAEPLAAPCLRAPPRRLPVGLVEPQPRLRVFLDRLNQQAGQVPAGDVLNRDDIRDCVARLKERNPFEIAGRRDRAFRLNQQGTRRRPYS